MSVPGSANPLLLASAAAAAGAYEIERSVRLNQADSAYLSFTPSSAGNRRTWTYSFWFKLGKTTGYQYFFSANNPSGGGSAFDFLQMDNNASTIAFNGYNGTSFDWKLSSDVVFRDPSAWQHFVIAFDTTQSTASDRVKWWHNGNLLTLNRSGYTTYPSLNFESRVNNTVSQRLSDQTYGLNSYLADVHFIDGQALTPTDFGEFDATTGVWNPIKYKGTYGSQGWHLLFDDNSSSSALGTDSSGNSHNWSVNNITSENPTTLPGVSFDGTNDYIESADDADYTFGSNDWTIECFVKSRDLSSHKAVVMKYSGTASTSSWWMSLLNGQISFFFYYGSGSQISGTTSSSITANVWSHLAVTRDGNTVRLYIDGVQSGTINVTGLTMNDTATPVRIAVDSQGNYDFNGIISNVRIVNGSCLYPSGTTFTVPTAPLTSVTNTKLLCCQSNSSVTTAAVSPNTLTSSGDAFAGTFSDSSAAEDSLRDSPTNGNPANDSGLGNQVSGNYATWNPLFVSSNSARTTISNGNLDVTSVTTPGNYAAVFATLGISSGKFYWEVTQNNSAAIMLGIAPASNPRDNYYLGESSNEWGYYSGNGTVYSGGISAASYTQYSTGDVVGIAFDADNGKLFFSLNGTWQGSSDPAAGTNPAASGITTLPQFPAVSEGTASQTLDVSANFGQRAFAYTAPSGYKALCTANLDDPTIADGSTAMDAVLWTGDGTTPRSITGLNFEPDFVWTKDRSIGGWSHCLYDKLRGNAVLHTNLTLGETATHPYGYVSSFDTNGFTLTTGASGNQQTNQSSATYVAWCWDGGSSTASNTDGSITSSVRANPTAGFSIVSYTGTGSIGTVGHGLGAQPAFMTIKNRDASGSWWTWFTSFSGTQYIRLDTTGVISSSGTLWNGLTPSSAAINLGTNNNTNGNNVDFIAYCWAPVEGYSAFGTYTGNGSTDGPFVYTGFRPAVVILKNITSTATYWSIQDNRRLGYNPDQDLLFPNTYDAENATSYMDFVSNGFKLRISSSFANSSSNNFMWAAWAENPFKYARAR